MRKNAQKKMADIVKFVHTSLLQVDIIMTVKTPQYII